MAAVGGRMETIAPRRSLFGADYLLLAGLVFVSAGVHLWLIAHTTVTARDSLGFGRFALAIQSPESSIPDGPHPDRSRIDVIRAAEQPPGYPLAIWATAKFVRHATDLPLPDSTLLAAQLVNAIAAVLLVVPTYLIGRMLFGRSVGFAAALLFQVLPVPAHITSDGLSEGMYLLAVATAVMFAVRSVRRPGVGGFLLCGLAVGMGYLVRPEALMVVAAVGAVAGWLALTRRWPRDLALGRVAALAVGVVLVAAPYMLLIGGWSKKPTADQLMTPPSGSPREALWKGQSRNTATPVGGLPIFAKWMDPPVEGASSRTLWGLQAVAEETGKSLNYGVAAFAVLGLVVLRRRIAAEPGLWVLLVLAALNAGVLVYLGARIGYVSERHTVLLAMIGCVFAAAALEPVAGCLARISNFGQFWAGKFGPVGLLVILVGTALPPALKPLHTNREGHKHAGRWLWAALQEHDAKNEPVAVIDPFEWAQWYGGRTLHHIPPDPPNAKAIYTVLENNAATPHSRLPRLQLAEDVAKSGTLVYYWPETGPREKATVHVYKTTR